MKKAALSLPACLPLMAQAVNKCDAGGKVTYTDAPCERPGGKTPGSFTPRPNMAESHETAEMKRKVANSEMTVTRTTTYGNGVQESRTLQPHEITRDVMNDLKRKRTVSVPAQQAAPPALQPAPAAQSSPRPLGREGNSASTACRPRSRPAVQCRPWGAEPGLGVREGEQPAIPAPNRAANREACKYLDNALAMNAAAARQPNSAATLDQLAESRRKLYEQRSQLQCEKLEPVT